MAHADAAATAQLTSPLTRQKPNPCFNRLAGIVIVVGIIYAGYYANSLSPNLAVVWSRRFNTGCYVPCCKRTIRPRDASIARSSTRSKSSSVP